MQKTDGNIVQIITMWIRACGFRHSTLFTHCLRLLERQRAKSHICSEDHLTCKASNAHLDRKSSLAVWMCLSPQACMVETWPPVWRYWKWVESTTLRLGTDLPPESHCLQQRFVWSSQVLAPGNAVVGKCGLSLPWLSAPLGGLAHTPNSIVHDAVHQSRRQSPNRWGHPTLDFPPSKMWAEYTAF